MSKLWFLILGLSAFQMIIACTSPAPPKDEVSPSIATPKEEDNEPQGFPEEVPTDTLQPEIDADSVESQPEETKESPN